MNKAKTNIKTAVTNFFGSVGYFFSALQWFWAVVLYFSLIEGFAESITPSVETKTVPVQPVPAIEFGQPSGLQVIITLAIVVIMFAISIYVIWKMPSVITKTGKKIAHNTADSFTPMVLKAQKKQMTKNNRVKLSYNIMILIKVALVSVPITLTFCSGFLEKQAMELHIAMIVAFLLAGFSVLFFITQYVLMWAFKICKAEVW